MEYSIFNLTSKQIKLLAKTKWWEIIDPKFVVLFQLQYLMRDDDDFLCLPIEEFRKAFEKVTGRIFFTHELLNPEKLMREVLGEEKSPSLKESIESLTELIHSRIV